MAHPILDAYVRSDFFGKIIFLSLLGLSILSWILIFYKVWLARLVERVSENIDQYFKKQKRNPLALDFNRFDSTLEAFNPFLSLYKKVQQGALELLKKNKELARTNSGSSAVFLSSTDIEQLAMHVDMTITKERKKLEKYLFILSTIFSLAPLLGLLGTVWGISVTFNQMPQSKNALSNDAVLSGLAMALGTTVFGIVVAIPALIGYNYLKHRFEDYAQQMDHFSSEILLSVEMQYRAVDVQ